MKPFLTLSLWLILFLPGCAQKKDGAVPSVGFPNKTGNQYTYQVTDSVRNTSYTVIVKVGAMSSLDNGTPVSMWTYTYPDHVDTSYVAVNRDSVVFYGGKQTIPAKIQILGLYRFPLKVGAKWRTAFVGDTSTVVSVAAVTIGGRAYPDTYKIHEHGHSYNYTVTRDIWYTPAVGMIRMDYNMLGANDSWKLISYVVQ